MIFSLALRNLRRNKRRTLLTAIAVAVAAMFYISMDSLMSGMDKSALRNLISLSNGALKITTSEYEEEEESTPLDYGIDYAPLASYLSSQEDVLGFTRRTKFLASVSWAGESEMTTGLVIEPSKDSTVFTLTNYITGDYLKDELSSEVLVGFSIAKKLGLSLSDMMVISADTKFNARNADLYTIVGIINSDDPLLNNSIVMSYADANYLLEIDGLATSVSVSLDVPSSKSFDQFYKKSEILKSNVKSKFPNYIATTYDDAAAEFRALMTMDRVFQNMFTAVVLLIGVIGISNSILMSFYERIREIGAMRAIGFTAKNIMTLFTFEGLSIGLIGATIGILLGFSVNAYLAYKGLPLAAFESSMDDLVNELPMWGVIYADLTIKRYVIAFIFSVGAALIAGLFPAKKAASIQVTEALRHV